MARFPDPELSDVHVVPARPPKGRPPDTGTDIELGETVGYGDDDGMIPLDRLEAAYSRLRAEDGTKREHDVSPLILIKRK